MRLEDLAVVVAAARKAAQDAFAEVEVDLSRPVRFIPGLKGEDGRDGSSVFWRREGDAIQLRQGDGPWSDVVSIAELVGPPGKPGENGARGRDGKPGRPGIDGQDGKNARGIDGRDGVGIADVKVDDEGDLIVTLSDGREINAGRVKGERGLRGRPGLSGGSGSGSTGGSATGGTVALDFGAAPGGSYIEETVVDASVTAASRVRAWVAGTTTDHNAVEHALIAGRLGLSVVPGTGQFTIYATTDLRITGEVALTWEAA